MLNYMLAIIEETQYSDVGFIIEKIKNHLKPCKNGKMISHLIKNASKFKNIGISAESARFIYKDHQFVVHCPVKPFRFMRDTLSFNGTIICNDIRLDELLDTIKLQAFVN